MRPVNRMPPVGPPGAYKTYAIARPAATHFKDAGCAEFDCQAYLHGWRTTVDESTELGKAQAYHIRRRAGRRFREERDDAGMTVFTFDAGQQCFRAPHKKPIERQPLYLVGNGDHRTYNPRLAARRKPSEWVDDFGEHQARLNDKLNRG